MKTMAILLLIIFSGLVYGNENHKSIKFKDAIISIPSEWNFIEQENCLIIRKDLVQSANHLNLCREVSSSKSNYFTMNDDKAWEAVTDGVPVLADVNVTNKFTGMSAIVLCKYKDDAGYHTDKCFQAEIVLPTHINFIFTGRGDLSLFKDYKESYLSFKIK